MKILLIMDPGLPVPPLKYGGHERLVYMFAEEYTRLGHSVTLLAGPGSYCSGNTVIYGVNDLKRSGWQKVKEIFFVWKYLLLNANKFDLVHNFGRLIYLLPVLNFSIKKIMTYGRPVSQKGIKTFTSLPNRNLVFTACSNYCVSTGNVAGSWHTVYNAIDFSKYTLVPVAKVNAPLMFLGRLDKVKGVHTAIKIAKATGNRLIVAGNIPETADNLAYYKTDIEPLLDGLEIQYVGPLNDADKNEWLGQAKALLFPIEWDEPFGMVMIEAMACGTPVIAFNRGAVPEIINDDNGIIVNNAEEMQQAAERIALIDRTECCKNAEERYDVKKIAGDYLRIFDNAG